MQLVTIRNTSTTTPGVDPERNATTAGRVEGDRVVLLDHRDVGALLAAGDLARAASADGPTIALADAELAPVVPAPGKIVCVGVNYADHIAEMGRTAPDYPTYFAKYPEALIGAHDDIWLPMPDLSVESDWEAELVVVVGSPLRHASLSEAAAGIAGFTVGNDFSVRDVQRRTSQFLAGKTFEHASPIGPNLTTTDEVGPDPALKISTIVNGTTKQLSSTEHLLFGPVDILVDLSRIVTLHPGDIVFTGTPGGVGAARTPPEWLTAGDEVVVEVTGIGACRNRCVVP